MTMRSVRPRPPRVAVWPAVVFALVLAAARDAQAQRAPERDTARFRTLLAFPVTDTASSHDAPLGGRLLLRLRREVDASGTAMGWTAAVYRLPVRDASRNLLYHSLGWHGPYPTDLFAWIHGRAYYPDERLLPVYGEPWEIRLACRGCDTAGEGDRVHFTSGLVEVGVRAARPEPLLRAGRRR